MAEGVVYKVRVDRRDHEIYSAIREALYRRGFLKSNTESSLVDFALRFLAVSLMGVSPEDVKRVKEDGGG